MNELMNGQIKTIQSMEVAKMIGKEHKEVMWMILLICLMHYGQ